MGTSVLVTSEVFATVITLSSLRTVMRHTLGGMSVTLILEVKPGDRHQHDSNAEDADHCDLLSHIHIQLENRLHRYEEDDHVGDDVDS